MLRACISRSQKGCFSSVKKRRHTLLKCAILSYRNVRSGAINRNLRYKQIRHTKTQNIINICTQHNRSFYTATDGDNKTTDYMRRHIGPQRRDLEEMLRVLEVSSFDELISKTIPQHIRLKDKLNLPEPLEEHEALAELKEIVSKNKVFTSMLGQGYYNTLTPAVILRNILENPSWYTPYTPYQAEISQGRLEMLLNFQTMVSELVGRPLCNASLLDEATACAEAMFMARSLLKNKRFTFVVSENVNPQNLAVIKTRAEPLGIVVNVVPDELLESAINKDVFGVLVQYPDTTGYISDFGQLTNKVHDNGSIMIASTDLLACTQLQPPGEWGADIVVGTSQRFGVPLGYGGPHAGFLATDEQYARKMPGRIIGVTRDSRGKPALRMALQTREQHIRRESATSNICTAQALLANVSAAYGIYHGPKGIGNIGDGVNHMARTLAHGAKQLGMAVVHDQFFDTVRLQGSANAQEYLQACWDRHINIRSDDTGAIVISCDETTTTQTLDSLFEALATVNKKDLTISAEAIANELSGESDSFPSQLVRQSSYMEQSVFSIYHSETAMMRYLYSLERKDLGLNTAMIPLGSCTMKLNAASVMIPITWPEIGGIHPFSPDWQTEGYKTMLGQMESWLAELTGFDSVSLQPNSGAQGEYTGLMTIRAYHESRGDFDRNICLIPTSAHGTNPASAAMVGLKVVPIKCDNHGNVDVEHLRKVAKKHSNKIASCMITYPSTHGVFEEAIGEMIDIVHSHGAQVYMDGANLQAQVGYCSPGDMGADVCHLNLHKTFCIPHGGGGPGLGPIAVAKHLTPYLPSHPVVPCGKDEDSAIGAVAAAPWSSASIVPIPWMYLRMMGTKGIQNATTMAIANANYMAKRLSPYYRILYTGANGFCAHEFILDLHPFKKSAKVTSEDVAKRLMDYGFHAPTMSFPVADTLMVEPTESEPKSELDRLCDALISIRAEIQQIEDGLISVEESALRGSPHTIDVVCANEWDRTYTREDASVITGSNKMFWPTVGRVDNVFGDKNPVCSCPTVEQMVSIQNQP